MPSGSEERQNEVRVDDPVLGAQEGKLLSAIFGESCPPLEPIELRGNSMLFPGSVTSAPVALIRHWVKHHLPTTQIEAISNLASAVLGDRDKAVKWLSEPNAAMDNRPPIDFVGEKDGYERVRNLLLRIEYGALA